MSSRKSKTNQPLWFLVAGIFFLCLAGSNMGQTPGGPPAGAGAPTNKNPNIDDRTRQVDESRLRNAELDAGAEQKNRELLEAAIANMKEDFSRIQIVRNDIARNLVARKPLDYKLISTQTAEINKRASRMSLYMRAHVAAEEKEDNSPEIKSEDMIGALIKLCKLIDSFTENPALKNASTINSKEMDKARENKANADRDLLSIIKLSARLQKQAEQMSQ
jgi:hypothetical protein